MYRIVYTLGERGKKEKKEKTSEVNRTENFSI